jgi:uncharacterized membrane protein
MPKSKLSAFLYLLVVFVSGGAVGASAYRLYMANPGHTSPAPAQKKFDPEEVRRRILTDMKAKIHLDDAQLKQVDQIMTETREGFHQIHDKFNAAGQQLRDQQIANVRAILRPDQQPLYDQWRAERDAERRRRQTQQEKK